MQKIKVLFVCIHNSARSQMAEAFLKEVGGEMFNVESAGLEPGKLNLVVVEAMKEVGIDISANKTKSVFDFYKNGALFNYVITVCDETSGEACPIFPGISKKLHWGFADPSALNGTNEEKLQSVRKIRDTIKERIIQFVSEIKNTIRE